MTFDTPRRLLVVCTDPNRMRAWGQVTAGPWEIELSADPTHAAALIAGDSLRGIIVDHLSADIAAGLLGSAGSLQPDAVRIAVGSTSQALKATSDELLDAGNTVDAALQAASGVRQLFDLLDSYPVRSLVGDIDELPAVPEVVSKLQGLMSNPLTQASALAHVVETDVALTAKVLQSVNSAYFGLVRTITSTEEAITYLGRQPLMALATQVALQKSFRKIRPEDLMAFETGANRAGNAARAISKKHDGDAFAAALLHGTGRLVLAANGSARLGGGHDRVISREMPLPVHCAAGALLLRRWRLPTRVVAAVAFHHNPRFAYGEGAHLARLVLASLVAIDEIPEEQTAGLIGSVLRTAIRDYWDLMGLHQDDLLTMSDDDFGPGEFGPTEPLHTADAPISPN